MDAPESRDKNTGLALQLKGLGSVETQVHNAITRAIIDRRLPPGTRLIENQLAQVFGISRMRMRKVLHSLGHTPFVTLEPHRGAFVARPKAEEARQIFEARRVLEEGIVRLLAERGSESDFEILKRHIEAEERARHDGDTVLAVRLAGEFHIVMAQATGNPILSEQLGGLIDRTRFIISVFGREGSHGCPAHTRIVDCLERRDADAAAERMRVHFEEIEASLDLDLESEKPIDFRRIFLQEDGKEHH